MGIAKGIVALLLLMLLAGWGWRDYQVSQVFGRDYRYSLVVASSTGGAVSFVSFDPAERQIFVLPFPEELAIKSRSVGEYTVGSLYKLGSYGGEGGELVRRKVQGFMRVPVPGYLIVEPGEIKENTLKWGLWSALWQGRSRANLSRLDTLALLYQSWWFTWKEAGEDELVRAGVLQAEGGGYRFRAERLQQYVGERLFDWGIAGSGVTMAVVNESGIDGMGADMADFINNLGFDVVSVKTGTEVREETSLRIPEKGQYRETVGILRRLLGVDTVETGEVESYRAEMVVRVGKDAEELF